MDGLKQQHAVAMQDSRQRLNEKNLRIEYLEAAINNLADLKPIIEKLDQDKVDIEERNSHEVETLLE